MSKIKTFTLILLTLWICSCASILEKTFNNKTVSQGNILNNQELSQLKIGMSKQEVLNVLGSSLITSTFNHNRWDYAYTQKIKNNNITTKHVILYFKNNRLANISSDLGNKTT